jgi:hypothetical protein
VDQNLASAPKTETVVDVYDELARSVEINLNIDKVWQMLELYCEHTHATDSAERE